MYNVCIRGSLILYAIVRTAVQTFLYHTIISRNLMGIKKLGINPIKIALHLNLFCSIL